MPGAGVVAYDCCHVRAGLRQCDLARPAHSVSHRLHGVAEPDSFSGRRRGETAESVRAALEPDGPAHLPGSGPGSRVGQAGPGGRLPLRRQPPEHVRRLCLPGRLPFDLRFVAKASLFYWPFVGWHLKRAGYIRVDRRRPRQTLRAFSAAGNQMRSGISMVIFPEGMRTWGKKVAPFKRGSFLLARQTGAPIVPVTIVGSHRRLPRGSVLIQPGGNGDHHPRADPKGPLPQPEARRPGAAGPADHRRELPASRSKPMKNEPLIRRIPGFSQPPRRPGLALLRLPLHGPARQPDPGDPRIPAFHPALVLPGPRPGVPGQAGAPDRVLHAGSPSREEAGLSALAGPEIGARGDAEGLLQPGHAVLSRGGHPLRLQGGRRHRRAGPEPGKDR